MMPIREVRVVMIDDDKDDFALVSEILGRSSLVKYQTEWVPNYEYALKRMATQDCDVFLLDYRLGAKTGLDLLIEAQRLQVRKPIIFLTSTDDAEIELLAMERGASYYVQKRQLGSDHLLERTIRYSIKHAQDAQKIRAGERLKAEKEFAESANRAKSLFLANMSHEIRTPLTSIIGFANLAADAAEAEKTKYLEVIERNANHLLSLVNDLLDLSKIEAGRYEVSIESCAWREIIEEVFESLSIAANKNDNSFALNVSGQLPKFLKTDSHGFRQILTNVIGNANKFTRGGSIVVNCLVGDYFNISVVDSGIGVDDKDRARLFQPFSQAQLGLHRQFGGTGLGLNLSRKLARALGGDLVLASSIPGKGSTFTLLLPAVWDHNEVKAKDPAADLKTTDLSGFRILVVEDSEDNQMLLRQMLSRTGAQIEMANDGREAVSKSSLGPYDVILMDIQMPDMDGFEATRQIRLAGCTTPIYSLSAHAMNEMKFFGTTNQFQGHFLKPIEPKVFLETLAKLKNHSKGIHA